jgi:hypothetical protein
VVIVAVWQRRCVWGIRGGEHGVGCGRGCERAICSGHSCSLRCACVMKGDCRVFVCVGAVAA